MQWTESLNFVPDQECFESSQREHAFESKSLNDNVVYDRINYVQLILLKICSTLASIAITVYGTVTVTHR